MIKKRIIAFGLALVMSLNNVSFVLADYEFVECEVSHESAEYEDCSEVGTCGEAGTCSEEDTCSEEGTCSEVGTCNEAEKPDEATDVCDYDVCNDSDETAETEVCEEEEKTIGTDEGNYGEAPTDEVDTPTDEEEASKEDEEELEELPPKDVVNRLLDEIMPVDGNVLVWDGLPSDTIQIDGVWLSLWELRATKQQ